MKLEFGSYILISKEGDIEVQKNGKLLISISGRCS
ncbi:collagenase-like PrtC family protease [Paenibacillus sp. V4I3]|nr:collagenase-like PrtC family protease [Paenibacillus sp. V4I3]